MTFQDSRCKLENAVSKELPLYIGLGKIVPDNTVVLGELKEGLHNLVILGSHLKGESSETLAEVGVTPPAVLEDEVAAVGRVKRFIQLLNHMG